MATRFDDASRVINGTHGTVTLNGRPWAEVTELQLKSTKTKEKIVRCGHMVPSYKTTEVVNKGSATFYHVDSDILTAEQGIFDGLEVSPTIVAPLKDPGALGAERIAVRGVNFDEMTVLEFKGATAMKKTLPFTFESWEPLDLIDVE